MDDNPVVLSTGDAFMRDTVKAVGAVLTLDYSNDIYVLGYTVYGTGFEVPIKRVKSCKTVAMLREFDAEVKALQVEAVRRLLT